MELLQKREIPIVDYTIDNFEQDIVTVHDLWPEIEKNVRRTK